MNENDFSVRPKYGDKNSKLPITYIFRMIFALLGVLFILLFTFRGVYQIAYTMIHFSGDVRALLTNDDLRRSEHWHNISRALKHSPGDWFDKLFTFFCYLIFLHGLLGMYYVIRTKYNRFKENKLFFLQIFSTVAVGFAVQALMGSKQDESSISLAISIPIALISSFHIGNGLYNACITLGISVSEKTKTIFRIISWIVALIAILQIIILFV